MTPGPGTAPTGLESIRSIVERRGGVGHRALIPRAPGSISSAGSGQTAGYSTSFGSGMVPTGANGRLRRYSSPVRGLPPRRTTIAGRSYSLAAWSQTFQEADTRMTRGPGMEGPGLGQEAPDAEQVPAFCASHAAPPEAARVVS